MKTDAPVPIDTIEEISALIETLHRAGQRLEDLTAGEVDTVADRDGRTFLLRGAQEHLRQNEAAKQAAIVNALPGHIALLDGQGIIVSVNEAWQRFGVANGLRNPDHGIGLDYVQICDSARGENCAEAAGVAAGIRAVLAGESGSFSLEYPCHSPTQQRWFLMTVTPLADGRLHGAVAMHLDVTAQRRNEENLRRFTKAMDAIADAIVLVDRSTMRIVHVNDAACRFEDRPREELLALEPWALLATSRAELERTYDDIIASGVAAPLEIPRQRKDGAQVYVELRRHALRAGGRWTLVSLMRDITERKQAALQLRESQRRFSGLLQTVELLAVMLDRAGRITYCNDYLLRLTGWREDEVVGKDWFDNFVPPELEGLREHFAALLAHQPDTLHHENEILTRSGERRLIRWNNTLLFAADGDVIGTASIGEDITERRKASARIAYLNRVYAVLSGINTLIVRVRDRDELFREACRIAVAAGGFLMSAIVMVDHRAMKAVPVALAGRDGELLNALREIIASIEDAPTAMVALAIRDKRPVVVSASGSDNGMPFGRKLAESGVCAIAVLPLVVANEAAGALALYAGEQEIFHAEELKLLSELAGDIALAIDHIEKQEKLDYLAYYDGLTGLANRSLFLERVALHVRSASSGGRRMALFLIDLERFKNINDSLGHQAGDELLRQVAGWLHRNLGDPSLAARLGADHFAVVLPEVRREGDLAKFVEKRMDAFVGHPFRVNDAVFRIPCKIGAAVYPEDGASAEILFMNAEAALKKAKAGGERYLFYTQNMNESAAAALTLENQLRQALDNGEFVLHYQPKVDLATGRIVGAEALIRWNDPRTGLVPPGRFIPMLEDTGLIQEVGRWALHQAIAEYLRWRGAGLAAVRIAVNVSPLQLRHRDFLAEVGKAIGIDARAAAGLELEITESVIMEDVRHSIASLEAIRAMGIRVAIDDFGTGFSSLSYLARLPTDTLKIDRSFVNDMTDTPEGLSLVATIINLAHSVKLKVVAEGVETDEQSRLLRLLNCDEMQGFLFSQPLPAEIFEARYLTQSASP